MDDAKSFYALAAGLGASWCVVQYTINRLDLSRRQLALLTVCSYEIFHYVRKITRRAQAAPAG